MQSGGMAPVAGYDAAGFVDQDRHQKAECPDALGNLADLFFECARALRRFGVSAVVSIHSMFVITKTPLTLRGAQRRYGLASVQFVGGVQARIGAKQCASRPFKLLAA